MGVGVLSYDFSKFRKTVPPVFSARQVARYGKQVTAKCSELVNTISRVSMALVGIGTPKLKNDIDQ